MPTAKAVVRFLRREGFIDKRQRGSHLVLQHPKTCYRTMAPMHPGELPNGLFRRILQDAGFTIEDLRRR